VDSKMMHSFCSVRLKQVSNNGNDNKSQVKGVRVRLIEVDVECNVHLHLIALDCVKHSTLVTKNSFVIHLSLDFNYHRNLISMAITDRLASQFQNAMVTKENTGKQLRLSILFTVPELPAIIHFALSNTCLRSNIMQLIFWTVNVTHPSFPVY